MPNHERIEIVLEPELVAVLRHLQADRADRKLQDTIRHLLHESQAVAETAQHQQIALRVDPIARGGYRGKRK